jgi:hypothetical protein
MAYWGKAFALKLEEAKKGRTWQIAQLRRIGKYAVPCL